MMLVSGSRIIKISRATVAAQLELAPGTLSLKSKGKFVTGYIALPDGVPASDIDVASLQLAGVQALDRPTDLVDRDGDGKAELAVKWDRQALQARLSAGESVTLTLSGRLLDGRRLAGSGTLRVIH